MSMLRKFWTVTRYARAARFWLLLALAAFAFFGCVETAKAQSAFETACPSNKEPRCTRGEAWADTQRQLSGYCSASNPNYVSAPDTWQIDTNPTNYAAAFSCRRADDNSITGFFLTKSAYWRACPLPEVWNETLKICMVPCESRPNRQWNPGQVGIVNGSTTCDNGCVGVIFNNSGEPGYTVSYGGGLECTPPPFPNGCEASQTAAGWRNSTIVAGVCLPPSAPCPEGSAKDPVTGECGNDTCPAGMVLNAFGQCEPSSNTCPAGQTKAPDGSCSPGDGNDCPAGQTKGPDGTCKPDGNGDGEGDEDETGTFSGGEDCNVPPSCSGDAILCGQARIQWRIDCNTRKDTKVNGGTCAAIPVCTGKNCDALEYAQLLQQWRTACALEQLKIPGGGTGSGDGIAEYFDGKYSSETDKLNAIAAEGDGLTDVTEESIWAGESTEGTPNPNLFGSPVSYCSFSASMDFFGHSIDPGPAFWELMSWIGWLVVASAYLWVAQKIGD